MISIAGLQKMTLMDYPGKVAAAVFLGGCNFRCGFCHNPALVDLKSDLPLIPEATFWDFLQKRLGLLEGVVVSGGEPLIHSDLPEFIKKIKALGYAVKLDTNGLNFPLLEKILREKLVDFIAMDIKGSLAQYPVICQVTTGLENIKKSIDLIMASGLDYEFRSTVMPKYHTPAILEQMGQMIKGAKKYSLQNFRNQQTLNPDFSQERPFKVNELEELRQIALKYVLECEIRN
ncbi:MAG: anaerobic ribonucleoside-triphosphate reductase activating protein [Candidatus Parcubacteria bacterium]|nr:anaerobic ribonucleoside-triphosphate reductase activating protein [Candidatus Parcubacteria bacterium]